MSSVLFDAAIKSADVLVHFGAGHSSELARYVALREASSTVLVEANPDIAAELQARTRNLAGVTVVRAAVGGSTGSGELNVFNFSALSSLRHPSKLTELYPGLRTIKTLPVATRTPAEILDEVSPDEATLTLVIDTPGEELSILRSLAESGHINRCRYVILHGSVTGLYENGGTADEAIGYLEKQSGKRLAQWPETDPEFVVTLLDMNLRAGGEQALKELSLAEADLADLRERYGKLLEEKMRQDRLLRSVGQSLEQVRECLGRIAGGDDAEAQLARKIMSVLSVEQKG